MSLHAEVDRKCVEADTALARAGNRLAEAINKYGKARDWTDTLLVIGGMVLGGLAVLAGSIAAAIILFSLGVPA